MFFEERTVVNGRKLIVARNKAFLEGHKKYPANPHIFLNHLRYKSGVDNLDPIGCYFVIYFIWVIIVIGIISVILFFTLNTIDEKVSNPDGYFVFSIVSAIVGVTFFFIYLTMLFKQLRPMLEYSRKTHEYKEILWNAIRLRRITVGKIKSVTSVDLRYSMGSRGGGNSYYAIEYLALIDQAVISDVFIVLAEVIDIYDLKRGDKVYVLFYGAHRFLL